MLKYKNMHKSGKFWNNNMYISVIIYKSIINILHQDVSNKK